MDGALRTGRRVALDLPRGRSSGGRGRHATPGSTGAAPADSRHLRAGPGRHRHVLRASPASSGSTGPRSIGSVEWLDGHFVRDSDAKVVIYSWNLQPDLIERALAGGARGYLSKVLTATRDRGRPRARRRRRGRGPRRRPRDQRRMPPVTGGPCGRALAAGGRGPGADHPGPERPGDRRPCLPRRRRGADLRAVGLRQDRRHPAGTGSGLGHHERFRARHGAADRSRTTCPPGRCAQSGPAAMWDRRPTIRDAWETRLTARRGRA